MFFVLLSGLVGLIGGTLIFVFILLPHAKADLDQVKRKHGLEHLQRGGLAILAIATAVLFISNYVIPGPTGALASVVFPLVLAVILMLGLRIWALR